MQFFFHRGFVAGHGERAVLIRHNRRIFRLEPDKAHAEVSCLEIIFFQEPVGPDIPIEDDHIRMGVFLFEVDGILDRHGTANPAAVGPLFISGADALDHDTPFKGGQRVFREAFLQFRLGHDTFVFTVRVNAGGFKLLAACGNNDDAVLNRLAVFVGPTEMPVLKFPLNPE